MKNWTASAFGNVKAATAHRSNDDGLGAIGLRPSTRSDEPFLRAVYESTRAEEFAAAGWRDDEVRTLLASQFSMQDTYYRRYYPEARFDVVLRGETAVGRFYHDWSGGEARVIDIALLPAYRGAGIGTWLMRAVVAAAARRAMPVTLHVEFGNPVRGLYGRLGFKPAGENGVYERMRRDAAPFDDAGDVAIAELVVGGNA